MNELHITHYNGVEVVDSREVAEMVEKPHRHLLRDIRGYVTILSEVNEPNFGLVEGQLKIEPSDFFIESSYKDNKGETRTCYLITKKGCDMIANKLIGRKGVLFTAAYVTAFEEMRSHLGHTTPEVSPNGLARLIAKSQEIMQTFGKSNFDIYVMMQGVYRAWNIPMPERFYKAERDPAEDQLLLSTWSNELKECAE